eukprot:4168120-Pleurochrysis_carterae.AAC.1
MAHPSGFTEDQPICECAARMPAAKRQVKKQGPNHGRAFWSCAKADGRTCNFFAWASPPVQSQSRPECSTQQHGAGSSDACGLGGSSSTDTYAAGPSAGAQIDGQCRMCRHPVSHKRVSASNRNGNAGRLFYDCAGCKSRGEKSFHWLTPSQGSLAKELPERQSLHFYVVDAASMKVLQQLFHVPAGVGLGLGRDYALSGHSGAAYDYLRVVDAWR